MKSFIIKTEEQFNKFVEFTNANWNDIDIVAFDLETNGLDETSVTPWGVGLAFQEDEGYYLVLRDPKGNAVLNSEAVNKFVTKILNNKKWIAHNAIYDALVWNHHFKENVVPTLHADTILMKHCLDEEPPFGLKEVSVLELGPWADKAQDELYESITRNGGSTTKTNLEMYKADTDVLGRYCTWDVMLTYKLYNKFQTRLESEGLLKFFYEDEVMPLYREVTIPMKKRGVNLDVDLLLDRKVKIKEVLLGLEDKVQSEIKNLIIDFEKEKLNQEFPLKKTGNFPKFLAQALGEGDLGSLSKKNLKGKEHLATVQWLLSDNSSLDPDLVDATQRLMFKSKYKEDRYVFNINSKNNLKWLFFDKLKEEIKGKTPAGEPKVDDEFLESLKGKHNFINTLQEYNVLSKISGTYIDGMLERSVNNTLYTSFLQFGTTSGRFASRNPNLQNYPAPQKTGSITDEFVNSIRHAIKARPGYKLIGADFTSLEPHIAAYVSEDPGLTDIFVAGKDFYSAIAIKQFNLNHLSAFKNDSNYLGDKDKEKRNIVKTYCFPKNVKVDTKLGIKNIQDVNLEDEVLTKKGYKKVIKTFNRKASTLTFVTKQGAFSCTEDHKIWSVADSKFKVASDFKPGDEVEFNTQFKNTNKDPVLPVYSTHSLDLLDSSDIKPISNLQFNPQLSYALGAFLGDGVCQYSIKYERSKKGLKSNYMAGYIGLCGLAEDLVLTKWSGIFTQYGFRVSSYVDKRGLTTKKIHDKHLVQMFQQTFKMFTEQPNGRSRKTLRIPDYVFNSSLESKAAFVAGLLDTDGYLKHNRTKKNSEVSFCSRDPSFAGELNYLLRTMGISSSINLSWNKTYKKYYYILRVSSEGKQKMREIGLHKHLVCPRKKQAIELAPNSKMNKELKAIVLLVEKKEEIQDVYDITVEEEHEFYANGIRVHNCLAAFYGAGASRISQVLGCSVEEAEELLQGYMQAFPGIKKFIERSHYSATKTGMIKTIFGRIRHLKRCKELHDLYGHELQNYFWARKRNLLEERKEYKNLLNNAVNFQIQGTAGHVMNRAMLLTSRLFKKNNLDAHIIMTIHDEQIIEVREDQVEDAKELIKYAMENAVDLQPLKLKATPIVGNTYGDCK